MTVSSSQESQARSALYELLSAAFLYPTEWTVKLLKDGAIKLASVASDSGWGPTADALVALGRGLTDVDCEALLGEYVQVFGHTVSADCAPYEGEYDQAHVFEKSQTLADLNGFYSAFGVAINPELKDRPDHISVELEFMHLLTLKEAHRLVRDHNNDSSSVCREAQERFLANHLANWAGTFAGRLAARSEPGGTYRLLATLLQVHMDRELEMFNLATLEARLSPLEGQDDEACVTESREVNA